MAAVNQQIQQFRWFSGVVFGILGGLAFDWIVGGDFTLLAAGVGAILGSGWAVGVNTMERNKPAPELPEFDVDYEIIENPDTDESSQNEHERVR